MLAMGAMHYKARIPRKGSSNDISPLTDVLEARGLFHEGLRTEEFISVWRLRWWTSQMPGLQTESSSAAERSRLFQSRRAEASPSEREVRSPREPFPTSA